MQTTESLTESIYKDGREKLKDGIKNLKEETRDAQKAVSDWLGEANNFMKRRPGTVAIGAGVVGLVAGVLLSRSFSAPADDSLADRVKNAIHNSGKTWDQARDGFDQIIAGVRSLVSGR